MTIFWCRVHILLIQQEVTQTKGKAASGRKQYGMMIEDTPPMSYLLD